jgi:osmotically-inducible protein OsmY
MHMPGNYRYEEERYGGQRGSTRRGGFGERGRDDDDFEQEERDRYRSSEYGREYGEGERFRGAGNEGSWRSRDRDYGRSLGGRDYERFDEEDSSGTAYNAGGRERSRYGASYGQAERNQGRSAGQRYGQSLRDANPAQGFGFTPDYDQASPRYGQGSQDYGRGSSYDDSLQRGQNQWRANQRYGQGSRGGSQADGWTAEPDEMRWGRQQGLYGSSEYGGYIASQRSQRDYQSHIGKGPKNWQRSDERIREEVCEALARHPEIDATDVDIRVQSGEVTLTGSVTDRRAKRIAEDVVEDVFGVKDVTNQIKVDKSATTRGQTGDRDVTAIAEREGRFGSEGTESQSRRTPPATTAGTTTTR